MSIFVYLKHSTTWTNEGFHPKKLSVNLPTLSFSGYYEKQCGKFNFCCFVTNGYNIQFSSCFSKKFCDYILQRERDRKRFGRMRKLSIRLTRLCGSRLFYVLWLMQLLSAFMMIYLFFYETIIDSLKNWQNHLAWNFAEIIAMLERINTPWSLNLNIWQFPNPHHYPQIV